MLDKFAANVGPERMAVPKARGLNFYQVLTLASIVEREAVLDEEKPLIAGVYQNRIDGIPGIKNKILNADPTVSTRSTPSSSTSSSSTTGRGTRSGCHRGRPGRACRCPRTWLGYNTYIVPGPRPRPDRHADPAVDRRGAGAGHGRQVHLLPGDPRRRRCARLRQDQGGARGEPAQVRLSVIGQAGPGGLRRPA